jgi:hypothetical protein
MGWVINRWTDLLFVDNKGNTESYVKSGNWNESKTYYPPDNINFSRKLKVYEMR